MWMLLAAAVIQSTSWCVGSDNQAILTKQELWFVGSARQCSSTFEQAWVGHVQSLPCRMSYSWTSPLWIMTVQSREKNNWHLHQWNFSHIQEAFTTNLWSRFLCFLLHVSPRALSMIHNLLMLNPLLYVKSLIWGWLGKPRACRRGLRWIQRELMDGTYGNHSLSFRSG